MTTSSVAAIKPRKPDHYQAIHDDIDMADFIPKHIQVAMDTELKTHRDRLLRLCKHSACMPQHIATVWQYKVEKMGIPNLRESLNIVEELLQEHNSVMQRYIPSPTNNGLVSIAPEGLIPVLEDIGNEAEWIRSILKRFNT